VIDQLMTLFSAYGAFGLAAVLAVNCLGVPFPSSLLMLAIGAMAADGDVALAPILGWGTAGAIAGDQAGYWAGRQGGTGLAARMANAMGGPTGLDRARAFADRWGGPGVFLTRWLLSPLGPFVNLASGMAGYSWLRFTAWGAAGEAVWVAGYVSIGAAFGGSIQALADLLGTASLFLAAGAVTAGLGFAVYRVARSGANEKTGDGGLTP
jgi:membrane-associated protein